MFRMLPTLALLLAAAPANAGTLYAEVGGWSVIKEEKSCSVQLEYEGPGESTLTFGRGIDFGLALVVTNYNWSAKQDDQYEVSLMLDGQIYGGKATGSVSGIQKGFLTFLEDDFEEHFRRGTTLNVYLGDEKIDQLSLSGTAAAVDAMNKCYARVQAEADAERREKQRWEHLPKDPFSKK